MGASSARAIIRTDFSRGEQVTAFAWLSLGAAMSALMSIVYLDVHIAGVPFPYPILLAFLFNLILTRTAKLWTTRWWVALVPVTCWLVVLLLLAFGIEMLSEVFCANNIRAFLLVFSGLIGGVLPLLRSK